MNENKSSKDIYNKENINKKENKKNKALNNLNSNLRENKELEHLDELISGEGTTQYGEFITSYFAWTGLNRQKSRANELNNMTKND